MESLEPIQHMVQEYAKDYNYVQIYWVVLVLVTLFVNSFMLLAGGNIDYKKQKQPPKDDVGWFEFRKRVGLNLFISMLVCIFLLWNVISMYCFGGHAGKYFSMEVDKLLTPRHQAAGVDSTSVLVALILGVISYMYKYYVAVKVSIFSRRQTYNIVQAFFVYLGCFCAPLALIADAPEFVQQESCFSMAELNWMHLLGTALCFFALYLHGEAHKVFAKLRRNRFGHITTTDYKLPKNSALFEVVGCPHYLGELLLHLAIGITLECHSPTWWLYCIYVLLDHVALARSTRQYYLEKFPDTYNKNLGMIIPYVL
jgi:hypothetical protein